MEMAEDIYTARQVYSLRECQEFIDLSEEIGYQDAPISMFGAEVRRPDVRNNARVILDDEELAEKIWRRALSHVPTIHIGLTWATLGQSDGGRRLRFDETLECIWNV
jgi:hypothetical protein